MIETLTEKKQLVWYLHKNLGLMKSSFKNNDIPGWTAVNYGGSEIYVPNASIKKLTFDEWVNHLRIKHLLKG